MCYNGLANENKTACDMQAKFKEDATMQNIYKVTFKYSESVYCSNIARAENENDVRARYSKKYEWVDIQPGTDSDLQAAERKGMPIVDCEHIEPAEPAQAEPTPAEPAEHAEMIETVLTVGLFDKDTCKQEISTPAARAILDEILLNRYGLYAYTMLDCFGCYTMRAGQIVHEPSIRIEIVTESPIENLSGMIQAIKDALNQESIMCKVQKAQIAFA